MTQPVFEAVSVASARKVDIVAALTEREINYGAASHVAATTSLARRIREKGELSIDIATVIDLAVMLSLDRDSRRLARSFPGIAAYSADNPDQYEQVLLDWRSEARGARIAAQVSFSNAVREAVREAIGAPEQVTRLFDGAAREFGRSVQSLIASGLTPADVSPSDEVGILARDIWVRMERDGRIPRFTAVRDIFWVDTLKLLDPSDGDAAHVKARIAEALALVFAEPDGLRTVVYHGFYFYTPVQWRFFRTAMWTGLADQLFIVHDDGFSGVFESWRRYFSNPLMPLPMSSGGIPEPSPQARALSRALSGEMVDVDQLGGLLKVYECKTPSDFVAAWTRHRRGPAEQGSSRLHLFAPDTDTIDRLLGRFSDLTVDGSTDLAQLPIGAFLLALHDCLVVSQGWSVHAEFNEQRLMAIFSSGMLEVDGSLPNPVSLVSVLRRALPYFRGCRDADAWVQRAESLSMLVSDAVTPLGERQHEASDLERIRTAVSNPLRLVPWADLAIDEAQMLHASLRSLADLANEISSRERQSINEHLSRLRPRLQRGMRNLPEGQRRQVEKTVESLGSSVTDDLYVSSLVEMVRILLGSEVDFDFSGEQGDRARVVLPLRGLDALGYAPSDEAVHVANLADGAFPSRVLPVGWPFRLDDLLDTAPEISRLLLKLRAETSALSDLYLLWLALDGAAQGKEVVLSWIVRLSNELRNPSPIVNLLTKPSRVSFHDSIVARLGGVEIALASMAEVDANIHVIVGPRPRDVSPVDVESPLRLVEAKAAASAFMCPRRFAIQWVMGPTASFAAQHHQQMLYGNVLGALELRNIPDFAAICSNLWLHLTEGERTSSEHNRRVKAGGARPEFTLTLNGNRRGTRPVDIAYRAAISGTHPPQELIATEDFVVLPPKPERDVQSEICKMCPVRDRCLKHLAE